MSFLFSTFSVNVARTKAYQFYPFVAKIYNQPPMQKIKQLPLRKIVLFTLLLGGVVAAWYVIRIIIELRDPRNAEFLQWFRGDEAARAALITTQREPCPNAPFLLPADGYIGLLYEDPRGPYSVRAPHQGIDIFGRDGIGVSPIYAAYDGYITREPTWRSSLIQRVPQDPLNPEKQIWLYYTHMADRNGNDYIEPAFPPNTREFFVEQGTLLGYMGNYSGNPTNPVGIHLHFSIVKDDGNGRYTNELDFNNTIDPTPYLGMSVNYQDASGRIGCDQPNG